MVLNEKVVKGSKRLFTTEYGADIHPDTPIKILDQIIKEHNFKKYISWITTSNVTLMIFLKMDLKMLPILLKNFLLLKRTKIDEFL